MLNEGLEIICEGRGGRIRISVAHAERTVKNRLERVGTSVADARLGVHDMAKRSEQRRVDSTRQGNENGRLATQAATQGTLQARVA